MTSEIVSLAVPLGQPTAGGSLDDLEGLLISGSPAEVAEIARRLQAEGLIGAGVLNDAVKQSGLADFASRYRADLAQRAFEEVAQNEDELGENVRIHANRNEADRYAVMENRAAESPDEATVAFPLVAETQLPSGRKDQVTIFVSVKDRPDRIDAMLDELAAMGKIGVVGDGGRVSEIPAPVVLRVCGLASGWRDRVRSARAG